MELKLNSMFQITKEFTFWSDSLPQIILTANPDGNLDYFNQSWYGYTGVSYEKSKGTGMFDHLHPNEKGEAVEYWKNAYENDHNFEMEYRIKGADGKYRWFISRSVPVFNNEGQISKWFGTCTDIHKSKEKTKKFEEINMELVKINKDVANFIYATSNELKAPVSNIEGLIEALKEVIIDKKDDEDGELMVNFMRKSVNQMYIAINELINVTMIHRSAIGSQNKGIDFSAIVNSVIDDLSTTIEEPILK